MLGLKGSARKTGCAGCFLFFRRPEINGCKSKLLFKSPATVKPAATCPLPRGEGLGRGHSPNRGNLSQYPNRPNTSLAACYPLSNSLPRGERTGWLFGLRVLQEKQVVQAAFCFSDDLYKRSIQAALHYYFQKSNQNQLSATVQAAFPILATCAGFPPVHRLFAAKFRGSKNAAR